MCVEVARSDVKVFRVKVCKCATSNTADQTHQVLSEQVCRRKSQTTRASFAARRKQVDRKPMSSQMRPISRSPASGPRFSFGCLQFLPLLLPRLQAPSLFLCLLPARIHAKKRLLSSLVLLLLLFLQIFSDIICFSGFSRQIVVGNIISHAARNQVCIFLVCVCL